MTEKKDEKKEPRLHRHQSPIIQVENDDSTGGPMIQQDDDTAFHPGRHRVGISTGNPDVPNLSPGGDVIIKR
jgi:hypothetical protein